MLTCSVPNCHSSHEARGLCGKHYQRAKAGKIPLPPKTRVTLSVEDKFKDNFVPEPFSGCWLWTGNVDSGGYGQLTMIHKKGYRTSIKAHRVSYQIHKGIIPRGLNVLHRCDTPPCVNPDHLWLGTHADNKHDCISKHRHAHGESNGTTKLSESQVLEIRAAYQSGPINQSEFGRRYGVNSSIICEIVHRKTWKHI